GVSAASNQSGHTSCGSSPQDTAHRSAWSSDRPTLLARYGSPLTTSLSRRIERPVASSNGSRGQRSALMALPPAGMSSGDWASMGAGSKLVMAAPEALGSG